MSFIYDALKKAEQEGKVEGTWVPRPIDEPHVAPPAIKLPQDVIREFALLKQNVQQAHAEQGTQIIAVTSSVPGEGCTTITYFLSLLLTQSMNGFYADVSDNQTSPVALKKKKNGVLLIDSNFEKPVLHRLFDVTLSPGLIDFAHHADSNDIFTKRLFANYLHLITAGKSDGNWHDIWNSDKVKKLFIKLKENFDYILIDAPPIIGHPETLALSKLTDGILLVVKANLTRLEVIDEAKGQLQSAGAKVLGVVLNERRFFIPGGIYRRI